MKFRTEYKSLQKRKKVARKLIKDKYQEIIYSEYDLNINDVVACVKSAPVFGIGFSGSPIEIEINQCEHFSKKEKCTNVRCPIWRKNNEYISAVEYYNSLCLEQRNLLKSIFKQR